MQNLGMWFCVILCKNTSILLKKSRLWCLDSLIFTNVGALKNDFGFRVLSFGYIFFHYLCANQNKKL